MGFEPWDNSDRASQDESFLRLIAPYINRTNYPPFLGLRGSLLLTLLDKIQPAHFMNKTGRLIIILRLRLIRVMLLHLINAEGWETTARELLPKSGEEPLHYKPKFMVLLDELIGLAESRAPLGGGRDKYRNQQFQEITESLTSIEETLHTLQSIPASLLTGRGGVDSTATRNSSSPRRNPHRKIRTSNPDHSGYTVSGFSSGASTAVPTHHSRSVPHPYDPTGTAVSSDQGNNNGGYAIYQS